MFVNYSNIMSPSATWSNRCWNYVAKRKAGNISSQPSFAISQVQWHFISVEHCHLVGTMVVHPGLAAPSDKYRCISSRCSINVHCLSTTPSIRHTRLFLFVCAHVCRADVRTPERLYFDATNSADNARAAR